MPTAAEIMKQMPTQFDVSKAGDLVAQIGFDLSGDDGGKWTVNIADGACEVADGLSEDATATIIMEATDYVDMVSGDLNPMTAFMTGKVKVDGDLSTIMKFQSIFGM